MQPQHKTFLTFRVRVCTRSQITRCWWHSTTKNLGHDGHCAGAQHRSQPHAGSALAAAGPGGSTFHLRTDRIGSVMAPPGQGCRIRTSQSWAVSCHSRTRSLPSGHVAELQDARAGWPRHELGSCLRLGFTPAGPAQVSLDLGNPQVPASPWPLQLLQRGQKAGLEIPAISSVHQPLPCFWDPRLCPAGCPVPLCV